MGQTGPSVSKRALVIGINYHGSSSALSGCVNDALNIRRRLIKQYEWQKEDIVVLRDDRSDRPSEQPTSERILYELEELIKSNCDTLVFHYSGHGGQTRDRNDDEDDGYDETLCPSDYDIHGPIVDDDIYDLLCLLSPPQTLYMIFDCCHSGSSADLPWTLDINDLRSTSKFKCKKSTRRSVEAEWPHKDSIINGCVVAISGCRDNQTSADTWEDRQAQGALTWALLKSLKDGKTECHALLNRVHEYLSHGYNQKPQMSFSECIDIETTRISWVL